MLRYPNINPTLRDTDDEGLDDGPEIAGAGSRPPSDPTLADSHGDHVNDLAEDNRGVAATDKKSRGMASLGTVTLCRIKSIEQLRSTAPGEWGYEALEWQRR